MMLGWEVAVVVSREPVHLPKCPIDPEQYDRLYAFNGETNDYTEDVIRWKDIRISPGTAEDAVYQMLPSAGRFEYGGYLTKTRIRFAKCNPTSANMPMSKACTFHSHPTNLATADSPSASDLYKFLSFRHLRTITVGSTRLWVWDKSKATLPVVKKLAVWVDENMLAEIHWLQKRFLHAWPDPYMKLALQHMGLTWPKRKKDWEVQWEEMVREAFKIEVRVFPRNRGANGR